MKKFLSLLSLFTLLAMMPAKKTRIIFFGDSITQAGIKPGGYIHRIQKHIDSVGLKSNYELVGAGISGNKVYDLYLRLEKDVLEKKPSVVVIYIGINDVWHKEMRVGTDIKKYEEFYTALIRKMQAKKIRVALCTPTVIGEKKNNANPQDADLDAYSDVVRKLAAEHNCTLIDLRQSFKQYEEEFNLENKESGLLTSDRVHLSAAGNQLVATQIMKALGIYK